MTEYSVGLPMGFLPDSIALGSDGNLWFVGRGSNMIGEITPTGTITLHAGASSTGSLSITSGPDGDLWFTETSANKIGKIDPTTFNVTEYTDPLIVSPIAIASGPDGDLYFTAGAGTPQVDRITTAGVVSSFGVGLTLNSSAGGITAGPDGNVYFTEVAGDRIGQLVLPGGIINVTPVNASVVATIQSSFVVATFADSSTSVGPLNFTATIDYGDGSRGAGMIVPVAGVPGHFQVIGTHIYQSVGTFAAQVTIGTADGSNLAPVTSQVTATSPIALTGDAIDGIAGRRSNTLVATFTDEDTTAIASDFLATILWADGTSSTGFVYETGSSLFSVYAGHVFVPSGSFVDSVTIVDTRFSLHATTTSTATIAPAPFFTPFNEIGPDTLTPGAGATGITSGPDGALWFTESNSGMIGRIDTSGNVTEFPVLTANSDPTGITSGPDGALWFTETAAGKIGKITTSGVVNEFSSSLITDSEPGSIVTGPDGNLWFTQFSTDQIGRFNPTTFQFTEFALPMGFRPDSITLGSDGNLWFVGFFSPEVGQITPQGVITLHPGLSSTGQRSITSGPDGDLWFTEGSVNKIGKIDPITFHVTEYSDPSISTPTAITSGPDGNLYFLGVTPITQVYRITTSGVVTALNSGLTLYSYPSGIATGPDGNVYFTETDGDRIGQLVLPQTSVTSLTAGPIGVVVGQTFSGTVATFSEASTIPTPSNFLAAINWGDGTSTTSSSPLAPTASSACPTRTFTRRSASIPAPFRSSIKPVPGSRPSPSTCSRRSPWRVSPSRSPPNGRPRNWLPCSSTIPPSGASTRIE